jgi:hypothetical protein
VDVENKKMAHSKSREICIFAEPISQEIDYTQEGLKFRNNEAVILK